MDLFAAGVILGIWFGPFITEPIYWFKAKILKKRQQRKLERQEKAREELRQYNKMIRKGFARLKAKREGRVIVEPDDA